MVSAGIRWANRRSVVGRIPGTDLIGAYLHPVSRRGPLPAHPPSCWCRDRAKSGSTADSTIALIWSFKSLPRVAGGGGQTWLPLPDAQNELVDHGSDDRGRLWLCRNTCSLRRRPNAQVGCLGSRRA